MTFRFMRLNRLFCIGLWFLVAANFLPWVARHFAFFTEDLVDGLHGFLLGIAIATMLLGIVRGRKSQCRSQQLGV
jgi:hypothetical protein